MGGKAAPSRARKANASQETVTAALPSLPFTPRAFSVPAHEITTAISGEQTSFPLQRKETADLGVEVSAAQSVEASVTGDS